MKYFQRRSDNRAPCSGFQGAVCAHAAAQSRKAGPVKAAAAADTVPFLINRRRVRSAMLIASPCLAEISPSILPLVKGQSFVITLPSSLDSADFFLSGAGGSRSGPR